MFMLRSIHQKILKRKDQNPNYQIYDLLQLSQKERQCRIQCFHATRKLKQWKKSGPESSASNLLFYSHIEGVLLRRQAQDAVILYRLIRKNRIRIFENYMENLPLRTNHFGGAR